MRNLSLKLLCFGYLLICLNSMYAWFFWNIKDHYIASFTLIICVFFYFKDTECLSVTKFRVTTAIVFIIASMYFSFSIGSLVISLPIAFFILLENDIQAKIITFITKVYSIIFLLSAVVWILLLIDINLPNGGIIFNDAWDDNYEYTNYFICIKSTAIYEFRFNCIFLEPGHTGMIAAFLLYINRFNFRNKYLWPIMLALLLTFSLAGYVLLLISVLSYNIFIVKKNVRNLIVLSLILVGVYLFFTNYNNGDNDVNNMIIERLQIVDGGIAGNNRTEDAVDGYFNGFLSGHNSLFGIGYEGFQRIGFSEGNSGYKVFIISNGLLGVVFVFITYLFFSLNHKSKESFLLLVLYSINFIQRSYPYWSIMLLIFIGGISLLNDTNKNEILNADA